MNPSSPAKLHPSNDKQLGLIDEGFPLLIVNLIAIKFVDCKYLNKLQFK